MTLVCEATGCSHTCATKTNYNPMKHLINSIPILCVALETQVFFLKCQDFLPRSACIAMFFVQFLTLSLFYFTWGVFLFLLECKAVVNIDFTALLSPQAPPLKLTAITVPSISTTQASLWSLSMMGSAHIWWVTLPSVRHCQSKVMNYIERKKAFVLIPTECCVFPAILSWECLRQSCALCFCWH